MAYATDLCGSKLRAKLNATLNESSSQKISKNSFAAKQMAKMGWTEGTGLGKNRDGIESHIKVRKREENIGLGIEKERARQYGAEAMWWSSSVSDTLMKLQKKKNRDGGKESKKSKKKKRQRENDQPKIYTDEELFVATGGARFGMRAQRRAEGKWQRTERSSELKRLELEANNRVEWNGLGKASVILSDTTSNKMAEPNLRSERSSKKRKRGDDGTNTKDGDGGASAIKSGHSSGSSKKEKKERMKDKKKQKKSSKKKKKDKNVDNE